MGGAPGSPTQRLNFEVDRGPARIHRINDDGGEDFVFQRIALGDIWIVDQAFQRAEIDHGGRIGTSPGPVVARDRPEIAGLGPPAPGIEHRRPVLGLTSRHRRDAPSDRP